LSSAETIALNFLVFEENALLYTRFMRQMDRQTNRQTNEQTNEQTKRYTNKQTNRRTASSP